MEPIPNEVDKTKQRNSDQDARHEEGPIVFWFSVHPKLDSVGLCRCLLYAHYERHESWRMPVKCFEQNFLAVRGNTFQARSELCFRERSAGGIACSWCCERYRQRLFA